MRLFLVTLFLMLPIGFGLVRLAVDVQQASASKVQHVCQVILK